MSAALIVVDINKEHVAVAEANKLGIPVFAIVDTNTDPRKVTYPIPANDDASKSIDLVLEYLTDAIAEGLAIRKEEKEKAKAEKEAAKQMAEKAEKKVEEAPEATPQAEEK